MPGSYRLRPHCGVFFLVDRGGRRWSAFSGVSFFGLPSGLPLRRMLLANGLAHLLRSGFLLLCHSQILLAGILPVSARLFDGLLILFKDPFVELVDHRLGLFAGLV